MKKIIALLVAVFSCAAARPFSADDIASFTLQNGLRLFVLSDTTAAPVRIALQVRAGYAAQTERTAGFFPLYARLLGADISADAVRLVRTVAPQEAERTVAALASCLAPLPLPDAVLAPALAQMKTEVSEYAASTAGFINTAIDARMFPAAPWQVESGVYPALFAAATVASARTVLHDIAATYYTPQNSALFISGNISVQAAHALAQKYFCADAAVAVPAAPSVPPAPPPHKYVLTDESLSADMTQIVVQYPQFSADEAAVAAAVLNDDGGTYKQRLTAERSLAILGAEYVNVASAQRFGSSRLIIQSLLGAGKASPCAQAEAFLRVIDGEGVLTEPEVCRALDRIAAEFRRRADDSAALMELLDDWTALVPHDSVAALFARAPALSAQVSAAQLESRLHERQPSVFVLVNAKKYAACAAEFKKAGYEVVTKKNGSWYTQRLYLAKLAQDAAPPAADTAGQNDGTDAARRFIAENRAQIASFSLANGIPVTVKQTPRAQTAAIALTVAGGELLFAQDAPGLCSVLTDALAVHVRRAVDARMAAGALSGDVAVQAQTNARCSVLTVTCAAAEVPECMRAVAEALVYGDISPALADGITYDERTQWRIRSGAATFQLLCSAMRTLYAKNPYSNLFDDSKDKPVTTDFTRIAAAYPVLLDASRFSLVVVGALADTDALAATLEQTFGALISQKETASIGERVAPPKMPRRVKRIQIRHLFLTDISADKAGPRPPVLVPTKHFADPALYCVPAPGLSTTDSALFNALFYEIAGRMQEKLGTAVRADVADDDIPFARLYAQDTVRISQTDAAYRAAIAELTGEIRSLVNAPPAATGSAQKAPLLAALENRWLMRALSATGTAAGTAALLQAGAMHGNPALYLDQYAAVSSATAEDYFIVMNRYFADLPDFRVYSVDSPR